MDPYEYKAEGKEERDRYGHNFSHMSGASAINLTQTFPPYSHTHTLPPLFSPSYPNRGQRQGHKGAR